MRMHRLHILRALWPHGMAWARSQAVAGAHARPAHTLVNTLIRCHTTGRARRTQAPPT